MFRLKDILGLCLLSSFCFAADDGNAQILQYSFERNGDTQYEYGFETSNGIKRQETGDAIPSIHDASNNAAIVKGSYSYPGPDGVIYTVKYVADEAGFHPEGDHLKIPPFTPWVPGQPVDDGHYKKDNTGQYKPEEGENVGSPVLKPKQLEDNYISGERILGNYRTTPSPISTTPKYLPSKKPNYISGESILDTFLTAKTLQPSSTYLPSSTTFSPPTYSSGENFLDSYSPLNAPRPFRAAANPTHIKIPTENKSKVRATRFTRGSKFLILVQ